MVSYPKEGKMFNPRGDLKRFLRVAALVWLFSALAQGQIAGLCNTGQTAATSTGCSGMLVAPNPAGGGTHTDGNWELAYPAPSLLSPTHGPCTLQAFFPAWVDTPNLAWLSNNSSAGSEWIAPYDGENNKPSGWYVYRTSFPVPAAIPGGGPPTGLNIGGRLTSDNAVYAFYLESPAGSSNCAVVSGPPVPIDPAGQGASDYQQWWNFNFENPIALTAGSDASLFVVVSNAYNNPPNGYSPTGMRIEFTSSSFH